LISVALKVSVQKEEKAHDEKIANANAKIKQAGTSTSRWIIAHRPDAGPRPVVREEGEEKRD
jgi:hypothetical protein